MKLIAEEFGLAIFSTIVICIMIILTFTFAGRAKTEIERGDVFDEITQIIESI